MDEANIQMQIIWIKINTKNEYKKNKTKKIVVCSQNYCTFIIRSESNISKSQIIASKLRP